VRFCAESYHQNHWRCRQPKRIKVTRFGNIIVSVGVGLLVLKETDHTGKQPEERQGATAAAPFAWINRMRDHLQRRSHIEPKWKKNQANGNQTERKQNDRAHCRHRSYLTMVIAPISREDCHEQEGERNLVGRIKAKDKIDAKKDKTEKGDSHFPKMLIFEKPDRATKADEPAGQHLRQHGW
jgi:hypothetical protein